MRQDGGKWKEITGWAFAEGHWLRRRHFTSQVLADIAQCISQNEQSHTGELMVAVEAVAPSRERNTHLRALEVFGRLRVWDTPFNTGVLLYLALDRHSIEIVADRGIAAPASVWEGICAKLQSRLQHGDYAAGVLDAVTAIEQALALYCAPLSQGQENRNDLPDEPILL